MCPLTPEETALTLRALDIDPTIQIYIAAGDIYKADKRMASLKQAFPNLVCVFLCDQSFFSKSYLSTKFSRVGKELARSL